MAFASVKIRVRKTSRIRWFLNRPSLSIGIFGYRSMMAPPNKPAPPDGPFSGKSGVIYNFTATTTDPDGDSLEYLFDWGDGSNSGWGGSKASHSWSNGSYNISVKARDVPYNTESPWSDPLTLSISKNKTFSDSSLFQLLIKRFLGLFPLISDIIENICL